MARTEAPLTTSCARTYLGVGAAAVLVALVLFLMGWGGPVAWFLVGGGVGLLLVGAAQLSSVRHRDVDGS